MWVHAWPVPVCRCDTWPCDRCVDAVTLLSCCMQGIIPPPFSEHHTQYVRNYLQNGRETVIGRTTEFIALHKERYAISVTLQVSKVGAREQQCRVGAAQAHCS